MKTLIILLFLGVSGTHLPGQAAAANNYDDLQNIKPLEVPAPNTAFKNCDPFPVPLYENFDAVTPPAMPLCWTAIVDSWSGWAFIQTRSDLDPFSPPNHLVMSNGGDTSADLLLVIPEVDADLDGLQLKFHGRGSTNGQLLLIGNYSLENNEFTPVETIILTETYAQYVVSLEAATGNRIAFKHGLGATWRVICIDNVVLEEEPDCAQPEALDATEITSSSAMLQWTPRNEETLWNIEWGLAGFEQGAGNTVEDVSEPSYLLTGLDQNTAYHFYVQANCGQDDTDVSTWAGPYAFKTCYAIPFFDGFEENFVHDTPVVGWAQQSESGLYSWHANNMTIGNQAPRTGEWNALLGWGSTHWMFVDVDVTAGTTYNFIMYARHDGSIFASGNIRVSYGLEGNIDAMTGVIVPQTSLTYGPYQELTGSFTPESSGRHFVGIRGSTNIDSWYIVVDDVYIIDPTMFGRISGTVTNAAGEAVEGALVTMADQAMVTDASGFYEFDEVLPGNYVLRAEAGGYAVEYIDIQIEEGDELAQDVVFQYTCPNLPFNPVEAGAIAYPAGVWQFMGSATDGNYIYKTLENNLLYVFDPANLGNILEISSLDVPQAGQLFFHDHLYVFSGTTVLVYDTSDPANLELLSTFAAGGIPRDMQFGGQTAWLLVHDNDMTSRLLELDISDPVEVTTLATLWVTSGNQGSIYYTPQRSLVYIHGLGEQNPATVSIVDVSEAGEPVVTCSETLGLVNSRMAAEKDHIFLAQNVGAQGQIQAYSTDDPAMPVLLAEQNLPEQAQVVEISNIAGTLMLHTQHPDDGHRLISMVFDDDENKFYEGVGLKRPDFGVTAKYDFVVGGFGGNEKDTDDNGSREEPLPNGMEEYYLLPKSQTSGDSHSPPKSPIIKIEKPPAEEDDEDCEAELTVSGFKASEYHCPSAIQDDPWLNVGGVNFCASLDDDWILGSFDLGASGSGHEVDDIALVEISGAGSFLGVYYADNGVINAVFSPPVQIPAGECRNFVVRYMFDFDTETYAHDQLRSFKWVTSGVSASPAECEEGEIIGMARMDSLTFARVFTYREGLLNTVYAKIQDAINHESTEDGDELKVCKGTYKEVITITKDLDIFSFEGRDKTTLAFPIDKNTKNQNKDDGYVIIGLSPFTLEGFTITTLPGLPFKNGIRLGPSTNTDQNVVRKVFINNNNFRRLHTAVSSGGHNPFAPKSRIAYLEIDSNVFSQLTGDPIFDDYIIHLKDGMGEVKVTNNSFSDHPLKTKHILLHSARTYHIENNQYGQSFKVMIRREYGNKFSGFVKDNEGFYPDKGMDLQVLVASRTYEPSEITIHVIGNRLDQLSVFLLQGPDRNDYAELLIKDNHIRNMTVSGLASGLQFSDNVVTRFARFIDLHRHKKPHIIERNEFEKSFLSVEFSRSVIIRKNTFNRSIFPASLITRLAEEISISENFIGKGRQNGIELFASRKVSLTQNRINENKIGVLAKNGHEIEIINNEFLLNCTSVKTEKVTNVVLTNNYIMSAWCLFSGVNSNQDSNLSIFGNSIIDNHGAGLFLQQPHNPLFTNNNVFGNTTGVFNQTTGVILANGNFWGTPDGPQEGDIIGNVDVDSWLEEPVNLNIAFLEREVYARHGETDSLLVFIQNLSDANDEIAVMFNDTKGWLVSESPIYTQFTDSTGFVFDLVFHIPEGELDSTLVTVTTTSALRNDWEAEGEVVIFSYDPHPAFVVAEPDSVAILQSDSLIVAARVYDQLDRRLDVPVTWSTTAGEVDEQGFFLPGEHVGVLTVTATATPQEVGGREIPAEPVSGHATIRVYEENVPLAHIILEPDTTHLTPGQSGFFSYDALCLEGFGVLLPDSNQLWTATGGEINDFGLYVAGEQSGIFEVTLTDLDSEVSGTAVVIIAEPPQLPSPTQLLSPADASEELPIPVVFSWTESENAEFYILEVGHEEHLDDPQLFLGLQDISYTYHNLEPYTTYFWRVFASSEAGVSSPSATWSFTTGEGEAPEVPETLHVTGAVAADAEECFNALQTIIVEDFVVEPGGSATLIAGENIVMLPGTHVQQGAWMHAYIAPDGPFCGEREEHFLEAELLAADDIIKEDTTKTKEEETGLQDITQKAFTTKLFTVFPNPTRDLFTIALQQCAEAELMRVEVYNMRGERIITEELPAGARNVFSLEEQQAGVYLVRVIVGERMGVERVVKW